MAFEDCVGKIKAALGDESTEDEIAELLEEIIRRKERLASRDALLGDAGAMTRAVQDLAAEKKLAALIEKRSLAINLLRKEERFRRYDAAPGMEADELSAMNVGRSDSRPGAAQSVDAARQGVLAGLWGPMLAELRQRNLLGLVRHRTEAFERDVANELSRLTDLSHGRDTGNAAARQVAEIIHRTQEKARIVQNDAGAWTRKMPGYIVAQSHDLHSIRRAGFETWRDFIAPRLDDRTFDDAKDRTKFLHDVWFALSTGVHDRATGDWLAGLKNSGNLAKKVSQERVLHFRTADDWFDYNQRFGRGSLFDALQHGINRAARNTALMRTWGTNPEAAFNADLRQLVARAAARHDDKTTRKLNRRILRGEFEAISGQLDTPASPTMARIAAQVRAVQTMAKLGGIVLSSFPDVAIQASALRHSGIGYLEGFGNALQSVLRGRGSAEQREVADLIGVGINGIIGEVSSRFSATDGFAGRTSKLVDTFFRLNLMSWWTDAHKTGAGLLLARHLAGLKGSAHADIPVKVRASLNRYGIGEAEWNTLRLADTVAADGRNFLTPDAVQRLPDATIRAYLGKPQANARTVAQARQRLEDALRTYYVDTVEEAMTVPGAREKALLTLGTQSGTAVGEAMRFIAQFKSFSLTYLTRHVARELKRGAKPDYFGLGLLIAMTSALGYTAMTAKDVLKGRNPRDPFKPATWGAAMQQGGGLGIYGDFLFGQYNRFGGGFWETALGPTAGTLSDMARIFSAVKSGDDAGPMAVRSAINNAPFANLFYTRTALDYLILYSIQEAMNPGYLRRMEARAERDFGQTFWLSPSQAVGQ